ncbi:MAG: hypothetical protein AAF074_24780, partial [Pseudomonadota bacterium]
RPGALVPPALSRIRESRGPFASEDDLLLAAFYGAPEYDALKAAGPIRTDDPLGPTPIVTLVRELVSRPTIRSVQVRLPAPDPGP